MEAAGTCKEVVLIFSAICFVFLELNHTLMLYLPSNEKELTGLGILLG